jgi:Tfp pilus assembly protein PilO
MAVALAAVAGYAGIVAPAQARLRQVAFQAHELYDLANRNERMLANYRALEAARARVRRDLRMLAGESGEDKATLSSLRLLQREAKTYRTSVLGLEPETSATKIAGESSLRITLLGSYRDVLALVADVTRHDALVEIESVRLEAAREAKGVTASVTATLFNGTDALMRKETERAASPVP